MSLSGVILGLINICIIVAIFVLIGFIILWILGLVGFPVPQMVQRLFMAIVALIALYMIVSLLLGLPPAWRVVRGEGMAVGAQSTGPPPIMREERR